MICIEYVKSILSNVPNKKISVIGDIVIDHNRILKQKRLSPEAPVIIFVQEEEEFRPGGAANVAANLKALGAKCTLISVTGFDRSEVLQYAQLSEYNSLIYHEKNRLTTVKERLITRRQQIARIDIQSNKPILVDSAERLLEQARSAIEESDAIVLSDYAHGCCIPELIRPIIEIANKKNIPVVVDSKAKDSFTKYKDATIALPNIDEAKLITHMEDCGDEVLIGRTMLEQMNLKAVGLTLGPRGILLITEYDEEYFKTLHDTDHEVVDVTGAGDTVAATVSLGLALGMSYPEIIRLANITAGIKVQKRGVAAITEKEILDTVQMFNLEIRK